MRLNYVPDMGVLFDARLIKVSFQGKTFQETNSFLFNQNPDFQNGNEEHVFRSLHALEEGLKAALCQAGVFSNVHNATFLPRGCLAGPPKASGEAVGNEKFLDQSKRRLLTNRPIVLAFLSDITREELLKNTRVLLPELCGWH